MDFAPRQGRTRADTGLTSGIRPLRKGSPVLHRVHGNERGPRAEACLVGNPIERGNPQTLQKCTPQSHTLNFEVWVVGPRVVLWREKTTNRNPFTAGMM